MTIGYADPEFGHVDRSLHPAGAVKIDLDKLAGGAFRDPLPSRARGADVRRTAKGA
jgi:hypothetical protein